MMKQQATKAHQTLFEILTGLSVSISEKTQWPRNRQPRHVEKAAREIGRRLTPEAQSVPTEIDLDELRKKVRAALKGQRSLHSLSARDRRHSPWVLFYPEGKERNWLAADIRLRETYVDWIEEQLRPSVISALLWTFLMAYPQNDEINEFWRLSLHRLIRKRARGRLAKWKERLDNFSFLKPNGPKIFARKICKDEAEVTDILEEAGVGGMLRSSAFMARVQSEMVEYSGSSLAGKHGVKVFQRVVALVETDGRLRFPDRSHNLAEGLLEPFLNQHPEVVLKEELCSFLLKHLKHPSARPDSWRRVSPPCVNLFKSWLLDETLEEFFEIVRRVALDHQWEYRERFWRAFHKRNLIEDAWIIFGPSAQSAGRSFLQENWGQFGRFQSGATIEGTQSALIFKVGGCTITEWSHNGKCRIWLRGSSNAPRLGKELYRVGELKADHADLAIVHNNADRGYWQDNAAKWFMDEVGIFVPKKEYYRGS